MLKDLTIGELREIYDKEDPEYNKHMFTFVGNIDLDLEMVFNLENVRLTRDELLKNISSYLNSIINSKFKRPNEKRFSCCTELCYDCSQCTVASYEKNSFEKFCDSYYNALKKEKEEKDNKERYEQEREFKEYLRLKKKFEEDE